MTCHPLAALWAPEAEPGHCGPSGMRWADRGKRDPMRASERSEDPVCVHAALCLPLTRYVLTYTHTCKGEIGSFD